MSTNRRTFLSQASSAAAAVAFPAVVKSASPNSKLQVASVGADGMAYSDIKNISGHAQVAYVGFCDIDKNRFGKVSSEFPGAAHFADYREMLAKLGDQVDAINVGIPDHMHAKVSIDAMRMGKHVYCQKPLAHTVWEARQMRLEAAKAKVVTQMGNQIHSNLEYRLGTRLIREGAIGKIKEVYSWVAVTGNERNKRLSPAPAAAVPSHVNWDLWIGVAPMRDYAPCYHPFVWRDWQDFGGGALGDFGCHILDPVFTALGLHAPTHLTAFNSGVNDQIWPTHETIEYSFPGNELCAEKTLKVTWMDGGLRPDRKLAKMPDALDLPRSGSLFIGEEGNLVLAHVAGPRLYPLEKFQGFKYPKEKGLSHWHRWVDACLGGEKTSDGFDYAGPLSETVQLGNIATRLATGEINQTTGRPLAPKTLEWDTQAFRFLNSPEADKLLTKNYRSGWEINV
jgi:predicted dehydrogenase